MKKVLSILAFVLPTMIFAQNYNLTQFGIWDDTTTVWNPSNNYAFMHECDTAMAGDTVAFIYDFNWINNNGVGVYVNFTSSNYNHNVGYIANSDITATPIANGKYIYHFIIPDTVTQPRQYSVRMGTGNSTVIFISGVDSAASNPNSIETYQASKIVRGIQYYDLSGRSCTPHSDGLFIRLTEYTDGTTSREKIFISGF